MALGSIASLKPSAIPAAPVRVSGGGTPVKSAQDTWTNSYGMPEAKVNQQVKSGQTNMTIGEIGAGVSVAAGLGLAFAVNPLVGIGVGALGLLASGASFFLGLCKITSATD